jgi:hypothetical protein
MAYSKEYPTSYIAGSNLACLAVLLVAFVGMYPLLNGLVSTTHLLVFILLWLALRKSLCTACYYYGRKCGTGWGKIASFLYKKSEKKEEIADRLAAFTWIAWFTIIPALAILYLTIAQFSYYRLGMLVLFGIAIGAHTRLHAECCFHCRNEKTCLGSPFKRKRGKKKAGKKRGKRGRKKKKRKKRRMG